MAVISMKQILRLVYTLVTKLVAGILRWRSTSSQNVTVSTLSTCNKTVKLADQDNDFVRDAAANDATILFVGTKNKLLKQLKKAIRAGQYYINHRWLGGTLTNWDTIQKRIASFERNQPHGRRRFEVLPKKVVLLNKQRTS